MNKLYMKNDLYFALLWIGFGVAAGAATEVFALWYHGSFSACYLWFFFF